MVDNQPYGKLIAPSEATKYHINILPGNHECYLEIIPKDENEEIYKSNILVCYSIDRDSTQSFVFFFRRKSIWKQRVLPNMKRNNKENQMIYLLT